MYKCDLQSLEELLRTFKIPRYSTVIVHSSIFRFGVIDGGINAFYNVLKNVFDETNTIIMPTFTFSFSQNRVWNCINTKSETGALTEYMRSLHPINRSINPFHSVVVEGPNKDYLLSSIATSSFGENSVFEKLSELGAYNLSIGSEFIGGATFCHYAEELLKVPYRYYKSFPGKVIDQENMEIDFDFKMYVRYIEENYYYDNDWNVFWEDVNRKGLVRYLKFNDKAPIFLMNVQESLDLLTDKINKNPYYVAKKIIT